MHCRFRGFVNALALSQRRLSKHISEGSAHSNPAYAYMLQSSSVPEHADGNLVCCQHIRQFHCWHSSQAALTRKGRA